MSGGEGPASVKTFQTPSVLPVLQHRKYQLTDHWSQLLLSSSQLPGCVQVVLNRDDVAHWSWLFSDIFWGHLMSMFLTWSHNPFDHYSELSLGTDIVMFFLVCCRTQTQAAPSTPEALSRKTLKPLGPSDPVWPESVSQHLHPGREFGVEPHSRPWTLTPTHVIWVHIQAAQNMLSPHSPFWFNPLTGLSVPYSQIHTLM